EFPDRCAVDVSAQHGVHTVALRVMRHSGFEFADETYCVFHGSFGIGAEGPVAKAETAPDKVNERIEREQRLIADVAREREPFHWTAARHRYVEFVTMNDQDALP